MQGWDSDLGTEAGRVAPLESTVTVLSPSFAPSEAPALIGILPGATDPGIRLRSEPSIQLAALASQRRFLIPPLAGTQSRIHSRPQGQGNHVGSGWLAESGR